MTGRLQIPRDIHRVADTAGESAYRSGDAPEARVRVAVHGGRGRSMIGICTDSNAQLPAVLVERYGIEVVPLTVEIDDREYLEGVDLPVDEFYALFADGGRRPDVRFNEPSPGQFAMAYDELVAKGCTEILSIHTAASCCTLRAARLAKHSVRVPVRLVDSGAARFRAGCAVWAAAEVVAAGACLDAAADLAEHLAPRVGTVFMTPSIEALLGCPSGRHRIRTLVDDNAAIVAEVDSMAEAVNTMAAYALRWRTTVAGMARVASVVGAAGAESTLPDRDGQLRVGVGWTGSSSEPIAAAIAHAVGESAEVAEVVQFRIGPSVGYEAGPDAVSCVMFTG